MTVTAVSDSRFLLARFQLDYVLRHRNPRNAIDALEKLPKDMPSAYKDTLGRIERAQNANALTVLSWLYHALHPLRRCELVEIISMKPGDRDLNPDYFCNSPELLAQACQALVEYDKSSDIVKFTHFTVQEFLEQRQFANLISRAIIAKVCLTYLMFDIFEGGIHPDRQSFNERRQKYQFSHYVV